MLHALLLLLLLQLFGEALVMVLRLPVPGMVVGLALLLGLLAWRARRLGADRAIPADLDALVKGLHGHLGLLFVPAGAGVLAQVDLVAREGPAILLAVVVSTALTMTVTAVIARGRTRQDAVPPAGDLPVGKAAG